ncbi:MAG TPA: hypothetical protein DCF33_11120 [Saprospirales bacterium]|nr:hypothetical protein [Saprospirales bacterium]
MEGLAGWGRFLLFKLTNFNGLSRLRKLGLQNKEIWLSFAWAWRKCVYLRVTTNPTKTINKILKDGT